MPRTVVRDIVIRTIYISNFWFYFPKCTNKQNISHRIYLILCVCVFILYMERKQSLYKKEAICRLYKSQYRPLKSGNNAVKFKLFIRWNLQKLMEFSEEKSP